MRQYIVNLTSNLIGKNNYDALAQNIGLTDKFIEHVKNDLDAKDVRKMSPETLGRVMCSLEVGDVMASKEQLCRGVHFAGDCEEMLRELLSLCLAYAIRDRLDYEHPTGVQLWEGRLPKLQSSYRSVIDGTVGGTIRRIVTKHLDRKPFSVDEVCREVCQELNSREPNSEHSVSPDDIRDNVASAILEIQKKRGVLSA